METGDVCCLARPRVDEVRGDPILHLSIPVEDLKSAREFYESALGCRVGRVRDDWLDVWFFGLQLTLKERPDEVSSADRQGVRHFGVVLRDRDAFDSLVTRLRSARVTWLAEPTAHAEAALSGKTGGKLADPSGNVIEIKYYDDPRLPRLRAHRHRTTKANRTPVAVEEANQHFPLQKATAPRSHHLTRRPTKGDQPMLTVGQLAQHLHTLDPNLPIGIIDIDRHPGSQRVSSATSGASTGRTTHRPCMRGRMSPEA